ncbi:MAG TPA: GNAT family N-acetyltransferase [Casimicrobiaceae bacterium]|nr:GNAT family N-acetyltransferase [Casimicrobiaceae bacterium]
MSITISEGYVAGCIGRIVQLHADYYSIATGFGMAFEAKVASELAQFCLSYRHGRDGIWLARRGKHIEGSIALDGSQVEQGHAHLRWFITSDQVRGQGTGKVLLREALTFADKRGYRSIDLWTFAGLHAARHLYESHGFRLAQEGTGSRWGSVVTEQQFVRSIS